jgi:hypothetical protein
MSTGPEHQPTPPDAQEQTADQRADSDDTTQADAGMAGGTGTVPGQATATPSGTQPHAEDDETSS